MAPHAIQAATLNVVGVYDENTVAANGPNSTAAGSSFNLSTFTTDVASAFAGGNGGVIQFETLQTNVNSFDASFGGGSKTMTVSFSTGVDFRSFTSGTVISGTQGAVNNSSSVFDTQLNFGPIGGGAPNEQVVKLGITVLSRNSTTYTSLMVRGILDDSSTIDLTDTISAGVSGDDTFFGLSAPSGRYFIGLLLDSPITTGDGRILFDDFGFITAAVPEPGTYALVAMGLAALGALRMCHSHSRQ